MRRVLNFTLDESSLHRGFKEMQEYLIRDQEGQRLAIANRLWPADNLDILESYATQSQAFYGASPEALNFGKADAARKRINNGSRSIPPARSSTC